MPVINVEGLIKLQTHHFYNIYSKFSQELAIALETLGKKCLGNKIFAWCHSNSPQINYYKGENAYTVDRCGGYHFNQELELSIRDCGQF